MSVREATGLHCFEKGRVFTTKLQGELLVLLCLLAILDAEVNL